MTPANSHPSPHGRFRTRLSRLSPRSRRAAAAIIGLALTGLLIRALAGGGREIARAASLMTHPALGWTWVAALCEVAAYLAYASAQSRLLRTAGHRVNAGWLASLAVAAQALNNFLPAGYLAANVLSFRELRRRCLTPAVTGWLLLISSVLYIGALAGFAVIGTQIGGGGAGEMATDVRTGALALFGVVVAAGLAAIGLMRRGRLSRAPAVRRLRAQLSEVTCSKRSIGVAAALFAGAWVADAACLVASLRALGASPPWAIVVIAYAGAQLVSFVPVTPGGLGLVEGSLTVLLSAGGGSGVRVLAAVLLYRVFSYWATAPAGAVGYLAVRRAGARYRDLLPSAATGLAPGPLGAIAIAEGGAGS